MRKMMVVGLLGLMSSSTLTSIADTVLLTNVINGVTWVYSVQNGCASLGGGSEDKPALPNGVKGDFVIPTLLGKYPVTNISYMAFADQTGMTSVIVPTSVVSIAGYAFKGCCSLTNMVLPFVGGSRTPVGTRQNPFDGETFGWIFGNGMSAYTADMVAVQQVYSVGYYGGENNHWCYLPPSLESVSITDEEYFHSYAFCGISMIKSIGIPSCLRGRGGDVFRGCSNLTDYHIQNITNWCHYGSGLVVDSSTVPLRNLYLNDELVQDLVIPGAVTNIGSAFIGFTNITSVVVPPTIDLKWSTFEGCSSLTNVIVPCSFNKLFQVLSASSGGSRPTDENLVVINRDGNKVLYAPKGLKSVCLSNVGAIESAEFQNCAMIEEIFIGGNTTNIQERAFVGCSGLKKLFFGGNAPKFSGSSIFDGVNPDCTIYVRRASTGWGVDIPGTWKGFNIDYFDYDDISIIADNLPHATDEIAYSTQLKATGGREPYAWSMDASGDATITKDGVLKIPARERAITSSQHLKFKVTVSDLKGVTATQTITITLDPSSNLRPVIDGQSPAYSIGTVRVGEPLTFIVNAHDNEGGPLTFYWTIDYTNKLDCADNELIWTPERENLGSHYLIARCADDKRYARGYGRWHFNVVSTNILHVAERLPYAIVGQPYDATVATFGGIEPYSFAMNVTRQESSFSNSGTVQNWTGNGRCWNVTLPFPFPFNGMSTNEVWISDEGTICLDGGFSNRLYSASVFKSRALIAPLWRSLNGNKQKIYLDDTVSGQFTIRWESVTYGLSTTEPDTCFAATLSEDGSIRFSYGNSCMGGCIGISSGDGIHAILLPDLQNVEMSGAQDILIMQPIAGNLHSTVSGGISGTPTIAGRYQIPVVVGDADDVVTNGVTELVVLPNENYSMTSPEPVPYAYFDTLYPDILAENGGNYDSAANAAAANGLNKIWECYVAGINPTNETDQFKATIVFDESGNATVKWDPDLNEDGTKSVRTYRVLGRKQLGDRDGWMDMDYVSELEKADYKFFKVTVEMP